ncbi:MAG: MBL fold metallo-hydrolase [Nitrospirae bacterium]|nr:MBL fold metallo-hydrolase [Nitrospirota bacterium]MBF0540983.1 MBL fold metallo-hydrolase [Nitrospirota bacterium]
MIIRCWGSRGSVPVSGCEYIKYGGDTTCFEIRTEDDQIIIVDAGSGIRRLGNKLLDEGRFEYNLFFTHAHWDHILGFPFFKPIYLPKTRIKIAGCPFSDKFIKKALNSAMFPPYFPIKLDEIRANVEYDNGNCKNEFRIGSVKVTMIRLSHPNQGLGYKFTEGDKSFVLLTDNELGFHHKGGRQTLEYQLFTEGADILMHDSEYTEKEYKTTKKWGHSTFNDAVKLALDAGVKTFGLIHHNQERTDDDLDKIVLQSKEIIQKHNSKMNCLAVAALSEFKL